MSTRMKIAHVTATFPPYWGGTGNVCYYNTRELARRGHEVHVFTAAVQGAPREEVREGVRVHRLRPLVQVGNAPVLPQIVTILRGFDVIHIHLPFVAGAELGSLGAALHRTPLVVTYHSDLVNDGTWRDLVFRLAMWSSRRTAILSADAVLFVSEGHAKTSVQHHVYEIRRNYCHILPNGVDTELFRPHSDFRETHHSLGLTLDAPVVGFVGVLDSAHHYKGLELLLAALTKAELSQVQLLVVGDGELKEYYVQLASKLAIGERIVFFGMARHEDLPALYRACDVLVIPSLVPESFGLVIVEAFACGVPVIVSDGPGVRSLVEQGVNGLLVSSGDTESLSKALITMLALQPEQRHAMGAAGRRKVEEKYAWEHIGEKLEAIYADLLSSPANVAPGQAIRQ